ncbi:4536_t:CDS:2, partial [Gigaspora margarita]
VIDIHYVHFSRLSREIYCKHDFLKTLKSSEYLIRLLPDILYYNYGFAIKVQGQQQEKAESYIINIKL